MNYTIEKKDDVTIDVVIPWADAAQKFDALMDSAVKGVSVKGFRKGAVPREIAESKVDRMHILSDTADALLRHHYGEIITKESLKVVGAPRVNITKLAEGNDIEVKIIVSVLPEIVLPKKWKDAIKKINKEQKKDAVVVADVDVDQEIEHIANSRAQHKEVDRVAQKNDHVKIDFTVKKDGVVIENGTSTDHSLVLGKGVFIPGFEEHVIGMKKGEEKTFDLTFPTDYHAKHLAGAQASFDVKVNVVEERVVPEINDAFAASLGSTFTTLDALKKSVRDGMTQERAKKHKEELRAHYLDALVDMIDVAVPEAVVHEEIHRMIGEFEQQIARTGMKFDAYIEKMGKTRADIEKEWAPQAKKRVVSALVLEQLAFDEEINVDQKEVEAEMNKTLAMYKGMKDFEKNIDMEQLYAFAKGMLRNDKVFEILEKI